MGRARITATKEEYIRTIYLVGLETGDGIKSVDIAQRLGLRKSTVSESLQELARQKLIRYKKYANIRLTKKGERLGQRLTYRHRILEVFLHATLGIPANEVHGEVDRLEHGFSDEVISRLAKFLNLPDRDPHGEAITYESNQ